MFSKEELQKKNHANNDSKNKRREISYFRNHVSLPVRSLRSLKKALSQPGNLEARARDLTLTSFAIPK